MNVWAGQLPDGLHALSQIASQENETDSDKSVRRANLPVATLWLPKIWCCLPLKNLPLQDLINKNEPWSKPDLYQPLWKSLAERGRICLITFASNRGWLATNFSKSSASFSTANEAFILDLHITSSFWIQKQPSVQPNCENTVKAKQWRKNALQSPTCAILLWSWKLQPFSCLRPPLTLIWGLDAFEKGILIG